METVTQIRFEFNLAILNFLQAKCCGNVFTLKRSTINCGAPLSAFPTRLRDQLMVYLQMVCSEECSKSQGLLTPLPINERLQRITIL